VDPWKARSLNDDPGVRAPKCFDIRFGKFAFVKEPSRPGHPVSRVICDFHHQVMKTS
jgi:hypothetical protein